MNGVSFIYLILKIFIVILGKVYYNMYMYTKSLKYRLYPTPAQQTRLRHTLSVCKDVYNSLLNERKHDYELTGKSPSRYDQQKHFPVWSKEFSEVGVIHSQVLQNVAVRVDLAFNAFFTRCKKGDTPGFPRLKSGGYDSFTYPQVGFKVEKNAIYLSKIGTVKAVLHRTVEGKQITAKPRKMEQTVKTCTVRRQGDKWFVCFAIEYTAVPLPASTETVGIDVGVKSFAALSSGKFIRNPKFLQTDAKALAKAQRKVEKHKKGSSDQRKARKVVRRIHERIRNRRHNFLHQKTRKLVNQYGVICIEKLDIKQMSKKPAPVPNTQNSGQFLPNGASQKASLNKAILDAGWGMFRSILTYKAESAGRKLIEVNPAWTSQNCSRCQTLVKKKLKDRVHFCPKCGLSLDRDTNAAINILRIGTS